jgi:hypothetical protein
MQNKSHMLRLAVIPMELEACMLRLASILYPLITIALSGNLIILFVAIGLGSTFYLTLAVFAGALPSLPLAWLLARDLST